MLFSPTRIAVTHLESGRTFCAGGLDAEPLDRFYSGGSN
jgi:methenyltetrahydromethanopterin cyclohydrolase